MLIVLICFDAEFWQLNHLEPSQFGMSKISSRPIPVVTQRQAKPPKPKMPIRRYEVPQDFGPEQWMECAKRCAQYLS